MLFGVLKSTTDTWHVQPIAGSLCARDKDILKGCYVPSTKRLLLLACLLCNANVNWRSQEYNSYISTGTFTSNVNVILALHKLWYGFKGGYED
jgi:hypothetical protein